jgi:hypothetical protein
MQSNTAGSNSNRRLRIVLAVHGFFVLPLFPQSINQKENAANPL